MTSLQETQSELANYVGLSSMMSEAGSGLYCDQLPDITEEGVASLCPETKTLDKLWKDIEARGIRRFYSMIVREINNTHRVHDGAKIICLIKEYKEVLAFALQYTLGAEIMHERLNSSNINIYTNLDAHDRSRELEESFIQRANDELADAVASFDIHNSDCFACAGDVQPNDIVTFTETTI